VNLGCFGVGRKKGRGPPRSDLVRQILKFIVQIGVIIPVDLEIVFSRISLCNCDGSIYPLDWAVRCSNAHASEYVLWSREYTTRKHVVLVHNESAT